MAGKRGAIGINEQQTSDYRRSLRKVGVNPDVVVIFSAVNTREVVEYSGIAPRISFDLVVRLAFCKHSMKISSQTTEAIVAPTELESSMASVHAHGLLNPSAELVEMGGREPGKTDSCLHRSHCQLATTSNERRHPLGLHSRS